MKHPLTLKSGYEMEIVEILTADGEPLPETRRFHYYHGVVVEVYYAVDNDDPDYVGYYCDPIAGNLNSRTYPSFAIDGVRIIYSTVADGVKVTNILTQDYIFRVKNLRKKR